MTAKEASDEALEFLILKVNGDFGAKTKLAKELGEEIGHPVPRQSVQAWLHPEPEKRIQPGLGMGLILLRIGAGITLSQTQPPRRAGGFASAKKLADEIKSIKTKKAKR